jgi:tetratricopeptide (TPR) repeat protein
MTAGSSSSLIGRDDVLSEVHNILFEPDPQDLALILLQGEEGVGKSSLLHAVVRDARDHGCLVLEARPQAVDLPPPFFLLHEILNSLATQKKRDILPQEGLRSLVTLGISYPGGKDKVVLPMGLLPFGESLESPEEREERLLAALSGREQRRKEEKQELYTNLADHLEEAAAERKILIAIDDLRYAENASMDFIRFFSLRTRGRNVKLVAACRPDTDIPEAVHSVLNDLDSERLLRRVAVNRLSEEQSLEFLTRLARGRAIPSGISREWIFTSRGNPLALVQLFRRGITSVGPTGEGPARVSSLSSRLSEDDRRTLLNAAILGRSFRFDFLHQMVGGDEEGLAGSVDSLINRGIIKERGGEVYEFSNDEFWNEIYKSTIESRRRILHRKAAEVYQKQYPEPAPDIIPEMAHHLYFGRIHDKSLLFNRYAATLAAEAFSPEVAIQHLERAREDLAALPGNHRVEESDVLKEIGQEYGAIGNLARADEFYGESLKKLPEEETTMRALILLSRAGAVRLMDKLWLTRQYCEEAIQLLEKAGHRRGLAVAHRNLGLAAVKEGRLGVARREIEITLELLDPEKDAKYLASCYIDLGDIYGEMNTPAEQARAINFYRKAIHKLEPLHDYRGLARTHTNLAATIAPTQPREGLREHLEALSCARRCKDELVIGLVLSNCVEIQIVLGEVDDAAKYNTEARQLLAKLNNPLGLQQIAMNDGIIAQQRKSYAESEKAFMESIKRAEELGYAPKLIEVVVHLAAMYEEWGKRSEAVLQIRRIMKEIGEDKISPMNRPAYDALKTRLGLENTGH